ncbi:MAG: hypothetical protein QW837_03815 [Conexivisphaerales archaeon]
MITNTINQVMTEIVDISVKVGYKLNLSETVRKLYTLKKWTCFVDKQV